MSSVQIVKESLPGWFAGHGVVGTSPAPLFASTFEVRKYVIVRANAGNSGTITIGPTSAQADDGFILAAGDSSPQIPADDLNKVWLIGSGSGQNYSWLAA